MKRPGGMRSVCYHDEWTLAGKKKGPANGVGASYCWCSVRLSDQDQFLRLCEISWLQPVEAHTVDAVDSSG
jgi:hypothetical protein